MAADRVTTGRNFSRIIFLACDEPFDSGSFDPEPTNEVLRAELLNRVDF
jgi:hypothetical protein